MILQTSQPTNWCRQYWDINFFHLYMLQKLETQFSQKYIFQKSHFICPFSRFYRAICLVFFWNILIWVPTTQFCGKLRNNFSDIGNLFLEPIIYVNGKFQRIFEKVRNKSWENLDEIWTKFIRIFNKHFG